MTVTFRVNSTEDAIPVIAAMATKVIAAAGHPGHGLDYVGSVITSDAVLDRIRTAYDRHTGNGLTPKEAVIEVGQAVVASYCDRAGIPAGWAADVTVDPDGVPHSVNGMCKATWRREPVNRLRPELGTTTQFGYPECGEDARVDRFVKAAQRKGYVPVYACPAHTRG